MRYARIHASVHQTNVDVLYDRTLSLSVYDSALFCLNETYLVAISENDQVWLRDDAHLKVTKHDDELYFHHIEVERKIINKKLKQKFPHK